jgi:arsenate reductase-like glutaredoxin family protein
MKHIYHLSTCNTCKKIIAAFGPLANVSLQDLKQTHISEKELDELATITGSYESLFNRRSRMYTSEGLAKKDLGEQDYKSYILSHYTFLKRPVIRVGDAVFVGYKKDTIGAAEVALKS